MRKLNSYLRYLRNRVRADKKMFLLYSVLRAAVIFCMVRQFLERNYEAVAICALVLLFFFVPSLLEDRLKIDIPPVFEGIIYLFVVAAYILGEIDNFYVNIPGWDTMLHTINGFLCAAVGFSLVDLLNKNSKRVNLSPIYVALGAFCFSMTIGVCWEFIECFCDLFFGQDMQKDYIVTSFQSVTLDPENLQRAIPVRHINETIIKTASGEIYTISGGYLDIGILDTMKDLFVNFLGAIFFSIAGYFYLKHGGATNKNYEKMVDGMIVRSTAGEEDGHKAKIGSTDFNAAENPDTIKVIKDTVTRLAEKTVVKSNEFVERSAQKTIERAEQSAMRKAERAEHSAKKAAERAEHSTRKAAARAERSAQKAAEHPEKYEAQAEMPERETAGESSGAVTAGKSGGTKFSSGEAPGETSEDRK